MNQIFTDLARSNAYEIIKLIQIESSIFRNVSLNENSKILDCEDMWLFQ